MKADYPESLPALVSFLSACQYYGRFIKNLSTIKEPLNRLRRGVPWRFGKEEKQAFDALKKALASSAVVITYDPKLAVKIDTDASKTGLGAVISHVFEDGTERPIEVCVSNVVSSRAELFPSGKRGSESCMGCHKVPQICVCKTVYACDRP